MISELLFMMVVFGLGYGMMRIYTEIWLWIADKLFNILMFLRIKLVGW